MENTWDFESEKPGLTPAPISIPFIDITVTIVKALGKKNDLLFHDAHILSRSLKAAFWGTF